MSALLRPGHARGVTPTNNTRHPDGSHHETADADLAR